MIGQDPQEFAGLSVPQLGHVGFIFGIGTSVSFGTSAQNQLAVCRRGHGGSPACCLQHMQFGTGRHVPNPRCIIKPQL